MFKKDKTDWSVETLVNMMEEGQAIFTHPVQRGEKWDRAKRSQLILSAMQDYPVPSLFALKKGNIFTFLDGKQRAFTLFRYQNNKFALSGDTPNIELESGESYEVANKYFDDLPEELQERILEFPFTIQTIEDATLDEAKEIFLRLNNGTALTPTERSRVKMSYLELVQKLAKHEILQIALTDSARNRYLDEDCVIKSWASLYITEPSFVSRDVRALMERATVTSEQAKEISGCYDRLLNAYRHIQATGKGSKVICKRMLKGLIGLTPMAQQSIADNILIEDFAEWIRTFFSGTDGISVNATYNEASGAGCNESVNIRKRRKAMYKHYKKTFTV